MGAALTVDLVSIFPGYFDVLDLSLAGRARSAGLLDVRVHDLRRWTHDRHRTVDDSPYGGGAGMVMKPEPWGEALDELLVDPAGRTVLLVPTPSGAPFTQADAADLATADHLVVACGRYEGIDQRVVDHARTRVEVREVSLGDYVLNGGEVAALAVVEAVARLLPGFMGNAGSLAEESHGESGLLEYPVYTKPASWRGLDVPPVLLSGDHAKVAAWRHEQALRRTAQRRPDLLHASHAVRADDPTTYELRPFTPGDTGELMTLQWACFDPDLREPYDVLRRDGQERTTTVLRSAGRLVGAVAGQALRVDGGDGVTEPRTVWRLSLLMVAPDLRGRGLGRLLLAHAEAQAPDGTHALQVLTRDGGEAARWYRRLGYRPRGRIEGDPGAPGVIVLERRPGGR